MGVAVAPASARLGGVPVRVVVVGEERSVREVTDLGGLMTAFRDGDVGAFEVLEPRVFAFCCRKARSLGAMEDEAHDVAQEVVVRIWMAGARSFDAQRGSLEGWLAVSCGNRLKDMWRRKERQRELESQAGVEVAVSPSAEDVFVGREGHEVRECLGRLTPAQREVLSLVMEGHTSQEIADELGLPGPRVRSIKFRAVQRMRQLLGGVGFSPSAAGPLPASGGPEPSAGGNTGDGDPEASHEDA
jgi:RNA polymerase sigma factor (sigma-70 family)